MASYLVELAFVAGIWLAAIFLISAQAKIRNRQRTRLDVESYRLVPPSLVAPVAAGLPVIELVIALGVLGSGAAGWAYTAASMLLVAFSIAMTINLLRGRQISCGCRNSDTKISWRLVTQNVGLASLAALVAVAGPASVFSIVFDSQLAPSEVWAYLIVALIGPLLVGTAVALWERSFSPLPTVTSRGAT